MIQAVLVNMPSESVTAAKRIETKSVIDRKVELELLRVRMLRGEIVRFCYLKTDGVTVKIDCGTLHSDSVGNNVKGTGAPKRLYNQFAYLSTMSLGWRSFRMENFIGIID